MIDFIFAGSQINLYNLFNNKMKYHIELNVSQRLMTDETFT